MKQEERIILEKGKSIRFLDYFIKNSPNNDGLVLFKEGGKLYEVHLGNFGTGTKSNIDTCKKYALLHFMLARPETFAGSLASKIFNSGSGTYHEYYLLNRKLEEEGIEMPEEITSGDGMNCMIFFNNEPISK